MFVSLSSPTKGWVGSGLKVTSLSPEGFRRPPPGRPRRSWSPTLWPGNLSSRWDTCRDKAWPLPPLGSALDTRRTPGTDKTIQSSSVTHSAFKIFFLHVPAICVTLSHTHTRGWLFDCTISDEESGDTTKWPAVFSQIPVVRNFANVVGILNDGRFFFDVRDSLRGCTDINGEDWDCGEQWSLLPVTSSWHGAGEEPDHFLQRRVQSPDQTWS